MKFEDIEYEQLSPGMKQYYDIKKNYKDILLFYRLGDFYELFFDDALIASKVLGLTLTSKNAGLKERIPMCGAPHHAIKSYVQDAISKGYKAALVEQVEDPKTAKGIVKREVTEVISKGTMTDLEFLDNKDFNYIGSILEYQTSYQVTYADISTGKIYSQNINKKLNNLLNIVLNNGFKEIIVESSIDQEIINIFHNRYNIDITISDGLMDKISIETNDIKSEKGLKHILYYLNITQLKDISIFTELSYINSNDYLYMDAHTIRNLELFETLRLKERNNSLLHLIDKCKTSMGSRCLKDWMLKPLTNIDRIENRYNKIDTLNKEYLDRTRLEDLLYEIYDIERLSGKLSSSSANARDLIQLSKSFKVLPEIKSIIEKLGFEYKLDDLKDLYSLIDESINEDAPVSIKEGYLIKDGYNKELDELRSIRRGGKDFINSILEDAINKTGIPNLKVGFNKVFGYYIEVTKSNIDKIDSKLNWERKQTLTGAERYISPELKEKENLILNAEEKIIELEYEIFIGIRNILKSNLKRLSNVSRIISEIDALYSLSISSENLSLVRPSITKDSSVKIINGRHPVVEKVVKGEYVKNDIIMDEDTSTLLITGPNMSGKSTFMREFACIVILAQMGSFVPADSASLPIFDKIFTRIGASDDLVSGESTFMVEMKEANNAILNATKNSLILFDELGRGTSTYDGMSIARAILEYINTHIKCKTLFSTHYHELTDLSIKYKEIKNVHVSASIDNDNLVFMHKVKEGSTDKSYGVHVAKLSGMPDEIINNANTLLNEYEKGVKKENSQLEFTFQEDVKPSEIDNYIKSLDINNITPREALDILYLLKEKV